MLSKKVKFVWTDDCQIAFDNVKLLLQKSLVLKFPDYENPFKLIIGSSDVGTGSVLVQEASDGLDHPVSYFSKKFLKYQKNYSVVEKETLGLVLSLEHFDVYLGSTRFKIKVYSDHYILTYPLTFFYYVIFLTCTGLLCQLTLSSWDLRTGLLCQLTLSSWDLPCMDVAS